MHSSTLMTAGIQIGAIALGYLCGLAIQYPGDAPSIYTDCAIFAALLMFGGVFESFVGRVVEKARHCTVVCIASLLYSIGVVMCEPFLRVHTTDQIVIAAFVLAPLLLAIGYFVRGQAWLSIAGVSLFVFISSAMIASNANASTRGSGFFGTWVA